MYTSTTQREPILYTCNIHIISLSEGTSSHGHTLKSHFTMVLIIVTDAIMTYSQSD